ncbi:MAG TPA: hypothetical protein VM889_10035 [Candidatus Thermoplasmatota archaeon]|nr:hypothetical protein [Candidatus Thermoplasmatota archaeon]
MNIRAILAIALALTVSAPAVLAGTPQNPEITDPADTPSLDLDIRKVWVTNEASSVTFHIQVTDLTLRQPLLDATGAEYRYHWRIDGKIRDLPFNIEGTVAYANTWTPAGVAFGMSAYGIGTYASSTMTGSRIELDAANDVVRLVSPRPTAGNFAMPEGTVLTDLKASTFIGHTAHPAFPGAARTSVDVTAVGRAYTIE